jgi:hypothetical protein
MPKSFELKKFSKKPMRCYMKCSKLSFFCVFFFRLLTLKLSKNLMDRALNRVSIIRYTTVKNIFEHKKKKKFE